VPARELFTRCLTPVTARGWHVLTFVVALSSIALQIGLDLSGGPTAGTRLMRTIDRFSFQSDLLVLFVTGVSAFRPVWRNRLWQVICLDAVLGSFVVGLTYLILLRPVVHTTGWDGVADNGLHYVVPLLMVVGWVVFGPHGRIVGSTVLLSVLWPFLWFCWAFGYGAITGFYPYPFMDIDTLDRPRALLNSFLVTILLLLSATVLWRLDRRLATVELFRGPAAGASNTTPRGCVS
jgi:hypothetical protein